MALFRWPVSSWVNFDNCCFSRTLSISSKFSNSLPWRYLSYIHKPFNSHRSSSEVASLISDIDKIYLLSFFNQSASRFISFADILKELAIDFIDFLSFKFSISLSFPLIFIVSFLLLVLNFMCSFFSSSSRWKLKSFIWEYIFFFRHRQVELNAPSSKHCFGSIPQILLQCFYFSPVQNVLQLSFRFFLWCSHIMHFPNIQGFSRQLSGLDF